MNWSTMKGDGKGGYVSVEAFFNGNHKEALVYGQGMADMNGVDVAMFSENGHYETFEPKVAEYTLRNISNGWLVGCRHNDLDAAIEEAQELCFVNGGQIALLEDGEAIKLVGVTGILLNLA